MATNHGDQGQTEPAHADSFEVSQRIQRWAGALWAKNRLSLAK
jgi:hypothetical protein